MALGVPLNDRIWGQFIELQDMGGSSLNDKEFTVCLLIYLFIFEVQRLNLFS
jgi:hypothetical protein